jgi:hypothetical protein
MAATKKSRRKPADNAVKGASFENLVREVLDEGNQESGGRLTYKEKPKLKLQNGGKVIPDFVVTTETPHEVRHFYIECQNRQRSTKDILYKIHHVRERHKAKTFIFVYAEKLGAELARAFKREAIEAKNLAQFRFFIQETASFINYNLSDIRVVRASEVSPSNPRLPLPQKTLTAFHSHPDSQKMVEEFLSREEGRAPETPETPD